MRRPTMGNLFFGSGTWELAAKMCGIDVMWEAEIEPFPVAVEAKRFPEAIQLGDVSKISGADIPPVDIMTNSSPCQDLSIAGKRDGLSGERSGLFNDAVRIAKEMLNAERNRTDDDIPVAEDRRPKLRFWCWENVPGALSSNKGEDFRTVIESVARLVQEDAVIPLPVKGWSNAGVVDLDGGQIAWRIMDAQYFGVPQRRRRIFLVADLAGKCAGEVLFERESLPGYFAEGFEAWKGASGGAEEGAGAAGGICLNDQGGERMGVSVDVAGTLRAQDHGNHPAVLAAWFCTEHSANSRSIGYEDETSPTLRAGVVPAAIALEHHPTDSRIGIQDGNAIQTLTSRMGTGGNNVPLVMTPDGPLAYTLKVRCGKEGGGKGALVQEEKSATLATSADQTLFQPQAFGISSDKSHAMLSDNPHSGFYEAKTSRALDQSGGNAVSSNQGGICVVAPVPETYDVRFTSEGSRVVRGHVYPTDTARTLSTDKPDPASNQGGVAILEKEPAYALQGSMIGRADKNGPQGSGINEDVSFTLTEADRHAVAAPADEHYSASKNSFFMNPSKEQAGTLVATDYKDPPIVNDTPNDEPIYIVRRLTPTECARLQGFPDWWCSDLAIPEPTDEEIAYWMEVWETWREVTKPDGKPKTEKQIRKWLADPHTDSAEYKMWGNGIALPCIIPMMKAMGDIIRES